MNEFEIVFYEKEDGTKPARDFLLSLDVKMRAKMVRTIGLLEKNGNRLREPESKTELPSKRQGSPSPPTTWRHWPRSPSRTSF